MLEKVKTVSGEAASKILWFNMSKEPVVYVNGKSFAPRSPDDMHRNLDIYFSQKELDDLEIVYTDIITKKAEADEGKLKTFKDRVFAENPMDREAIEEVIKTEKVQGLYQIWNSLKDGEEAPFKELDVHRIPVTEERSAGEACFDMIVELLKLASLNALHLLGPDGTWKDNQRHGDCLPHQGNPDYNGVEENGRD